MEALWRNEKIRAGVRFLAASGAVYLAFRFLLPLLLPFLIAALLAIMIYPVVRLLHQKLRVPAMLSGGVVLLVSVGALSVMLFYLGRILVTQLAGFFQNFPVYQEYLSKRVNGLCCGCDSFLRLEKGTVMGVLSAAMSRVMEHIQSDVLPALTAKTLQFATGTAVAAGAFLIVMVSALMILKDMEKYLSTYRGLEELPVVGPMLKNLRGGSAAYLKTQLCLLGIIAAVLSVGLGLLKNPYALVIGIGIAIFDAFPILGSGLILVPWAAVRLFAGDYYQAVVLVILYLLCQVVREVVEPKMLGGKLGVRPVAAMMAIYIGVKLFGVAGVLLGPLGLILVLGLTKQERRDTI